MATMGVPNIGETPVVLAPAAIRTEFIGHALYPMAAHADVRRPRRPRRRRCPRRPRRPPRPPLHPLRPRRPRRRLSLRRPSTSAAASTLALAGRRAEATRQRTSSPRGRSCPCRQAWVDHPPTSLPTSTSIQAVAPSGFTAARGLSGPAQGRGTSSRSPTTALHVPTLAWPSAP